MGFENCSKFHHQPREMGTLLVTMARSKHNGQVLSVFMLMFMERDYIFPFYSGELKVLIYIKVNGLVLRYAHVYIFALMGHHNTMRWNMI